MNEGNLDMFDEDIDDSVLNCPANIDSEHAWTKTMAETVDLLSTRFVEVHKMDEEKAKRFARDIAFTFSQHFGGQVMYYPKGDKLKREMRDIEIWHDFRGKNVPELVLKYNLTRPRIYEIVNRQRTIRLKKIQPQLPGFE